MNQRTVHIVQKLSHTSDRCSLSSLADAFGVSERTIRNDIKSLNKFLSQEGIGDITFGSKGVIVLPAGFSRAEELLPVEDTFAYKMSSEERKQLGAALLVGAKGYYTLGEIAEKFSVSRATILNDLDGIKERIQEAGLEVESKPSRGIRVKGAESLKRSYLLDFASKKAPIVDQWLALSDNAEIRLDTVTVKKVLNEQCHAFGITMMDAPFQLATKHLCICVTRNRNGFRLENFGGSYHGIDASGGGVSDFENKVIDLVEQYCSVEMGENEKLFFAALSQSLRLQGGAQFSMYDMQIQKLSRVFIRDMSNAVGIDMNGDYDLFEYLSNHLESMFTTGPSHFPDVPALAEVVNDQPEILEAVKENLEPLERFAGRQISTVEITYIALHICAALERRKNRGVRPRVIVVCDGGIGTSQLLAEELRGHFEIKLVKVMPAHDVPYIDSYHADLVISTVPLNNCPVDHVVIKLPLRDREYRLIHEKLASIESSVRMSASSVDELSSQGLLEKIEPVIEKYGGAESGLLNEIRIEVRRYFREAQHVEDQLVSPYLHQLLPASHIELNVDCSDWRDAIRKSAQLLLDMGYIESRYVDALIGGVEKYGPYIVLAPGFAIPHSAPENGTVKMGMSLIRLSKPVCFGSEENDPIEFICTLSAVDRKMHLKAFANLLDMITAQGSPFLRELRGANTPAEAAAIIERYEYMLIRQ